ncbi:uncharacterized protein [Primulina huaijiensis]|uniref:uncharacterized protein n=1 Tax=Primulina huaijiensis TaxID=1492673 RepID=UPI003CC747E6
MRMGVQDEIPPLKDDMKPETQAVICKQLDIRNHDTQISSNITKSYLDKKQLPVERASSDILKKFDTSRWSDVGLVTNPIMTHSADFSQETNAGVSLKEDGDTLIWNVSGEGVEEKNSKVMIFNPSSKNKVLSMTFDEENHNECNTTLAMACSPSLPVHETELLCFKQGRTCYSFSDEAEYFLDVPCNGWLSEGELPLFLEFSLEEDKSLHEPLGASAKGHQHDSPPIDSSTLLACDAAKKPSRTYETLHNSFSTTDEQIMTSNAVQSSELVYSYCSRDNEKEERSVISSSQYTPVISLNLLDSSSANYNLTAENIYMLLLGLMVAIIIFPLSKHVLLLRKLYPMKSRLWIFFLLSQS